MQHMQGYVYGETPYGVLIRLVYARLCDSEVYSDAPHSVLIHAGCRC